MKKLLLFYFLLTTFCAAAQASLSNDTLIWRASRPLQWTDFKGEIIDGIGISGEIFCLNTANFTQENVDLPVNFSVTSVFDRTKSWVVLKGQTKQALVYFQITFDIYEVHGRKLRKHLGEAVFGLDPNKVFQSLYNASMTELINEVNQFKRVSKMGTSIAETKKWRLKVDEELKQLGSYKN